MKTKTITITLTEAQMHAIDEIGFCISTEDCDPIWACTEPGGKGGAYTTPSGWSFDLAPICSPSTLEDFHSAQSIIQDAFHAAPANS